MCDCYLINARFFRITIDIPSILERERLKERLRGVMVSTDVRNAKVSTECFDISEASYAFHQLHNARAYLALLLFGMAS